LVPERPTVITRRRPVLGGLLAVGLVGLGEPALAAEIQVAVAANFIEPAQQVATAFADATGNKVTLTFGSSGRLYAQIKQGAPYEVFLSADAERPAQAEQDGLAVAGTRFIYAVGRLVLYSSKPGLAASALKAGRFTKLAIADPTVAPYGLAAVQTLKTLGIYDAVKPKIVTGSSITQAYELVVTGAADLGLVALSQVIRKPGGSHWLIPASDHAPIVQQGILLSAGRNDPAAKAFLAFLRSPQAKTIIQHYGYEVR
jgi:molybdate transport system substrate-binding protein